MELGNKKKTCELNLHTWEEIESPAPQS